MRIAYEAEDFRMVSLPAAVLVDALLKGLPKPRRQELLDRAGSLGAMLQNRVREAEAAHPGVRLDPQEFCAYLAARLSLDDSDVETALSELRMTDLFLACAVLFGDPAAMREFKNELLPKLDPTLNGLGIAGAGAEEIKQALSERLFVGGRGSRPKIAEYSGRGDLLNWLRVVTVRFVRNQLRKTRKETPLDDGSLINVAADRPDPEIEYMREHYREEFQAAFSEAIERLSGRERNLLRHQIIDGLNVDQIGAIYHVHRSTAARQLAAARESLIQNTLKRMAARLKSSPAEIQSILRLITSQLHASVIRLLKRSSAKKPSRS